MPRAVSEFDQLGGERRVFWNLQAHRRLAGHRCNPTALLVNEISQRPPQLAPLGFYRLRIVGYGSPRLRTKPDSARSSPRLIALRIAVQKRSSAAVTAVTLPFERRQDQ